MAFIRISHSVSYVRQFDFLNDQGGIKAQLHVYNETIVFPIAFKKVVNVSVTPVGRSGTNTYKSFVRVNELSAQNFMANSDDVTISKLYWIAYGI